MRLRQRMKWSLLIVALGAGVTITYLYLFTYDPPDLLQVKMDAEYRLRNALLLDKGTGCNMPTLDPFAPEVYIKSAEIPKIKCYGKDWVKCYHSECRVLDNLGVKDIRCNISDIIYKSDNEYTLGPPTDMENGVYQLRASDHIKVSCAGIYNKTDEVVQWDGVTLGLRPVEPTKPPQGREDSYNVLIFGFDSTSRNGFIRRMPKSWRVLTEDLGAVVLESYNIVGDGTPAALFPLLTGKMEFELPEARKRKLPYGTLDSFPFIFYKLKEDGYRTAYFEDTPKYGTFQYRFNGWQRQPADHYMRAFYLEQQASTRSKWWRGGKSKYCVGDTPQFKLMMNITEQFMELDGKRFALTFIADITHDCDLVQSADEDFAEFLRAFRAYTEDTLLVVMGDHGPRYAKLRDTLQGKLEERLPLMALLLPAALVRERPSALATLQANARALTTPHDLHATLLDVLGMTQHWNPYRLRGADLKRGLTLLEPVPSNRSCSEAGIELHWCACFAWQNISTSHPLYDISARALLGFINELVSEVGSKCIPRTLISTPWVLRQRPNNRFLAFSGAKDADGYIGYFDGETDINKENYQIKIVVGPGRGMYEASMTYITEQDKFVINARDISRTNAYGAEPHCISDTHPHLNKFCYCEQQTNN